jgi:hypothetical protein
VIKIIAVLCSLASPASCHEQIVTTSDFPKVSMQSCLTGAPQVVDNNLRTRQTRAGQTAGYRAD